MSQHALAGLATRDQAADTANAARIQSTPTKVGAYWTTRSVKSHDRAMRTLGIATVDFAPLAFRVPAEHLAADTGLATGVLAVLGIVAIALLVLFFAAVVSILGSARLSSSGKVVWIVICLILQFFGPVGWFVWGRKQNFSV